MEILDKNVFLNFRVLDYIRHGWLHLIPDNHPPDLLAAKQMADELWETKHGAVVTFSSANGSLEILYDHAGSFIGAQLEFYSTGEENRLGDNVEGEGAIRLADFLENEKLDGLFLDDAYLDLDELVLYAKSGVDLHLNRLVDKENIYRIVKITSDSQVARSARSLNPAVILDNIASSIFILPLPDRI